MSDAITKLASMSDEEKNLIQRNAQQRKKELGELIERANEAAKNTARAAQIDYKNYINPYGKQAEALSEAGLKNSSLGETNRTKAYNAYQNRLSEATRTAAGEISAVNDDLTSLSIETDRNLLESSIAKAKRELDDYWKNLEWEYKKGRDALEDERYEKEWAYKLTNSSSASSSRSSGSSRSGTSSSSSSSKSAASDKGFDISSLSHLGDYVIAGAKRDERDIQKYMDIAEAFGKVKDFPNYYPQLGTLISQAAMNGATEAELRELAQKWQK